VWDVLEDVIKEHPVLLNRAPTLHRLGIQAFEPVLVEGKAINVHPLVCTAFNADFDGDQMAVHLPLSAEAQAEARVLMLSSNNVLSPAHGRPLVTPTQDMIIGAFYLTELVDGAQGAGKVFRRIDQLERAYEAGEISLHAEIEYRTPQLLRSDESGDNAVYEKTTCGRVFFNRALPEDFGYINFLIRKGDMSKIVDRLATDFPKAVVARSLDEMKGLCFNFAMRSGITISINDVKTPASKAAILDRHEAEAEKVEKQFHRGIITDGERIQKEVEIWSEATTEVTAAMELSLKQDQFNPIEMMVGSGARGNMMQVRQIAGMRGLVANPRGDMIPRPIKSNFREGLSVLEYFIATPGARKGLVDTALRTADSGYLTRRLVDVAQELIINSEDPFAVDGTIRGIWLEDIEPDSAGKRTYLETRLFSRFLADDVKLADGTVIPRGTEVNLDHMAAMRDDETVTRVRVLSPLTDESELGVSAACYGTSLATGKTIEIGEAVGVIAAQSIGEPGTQLTMRTFHTGGIAGAAGDITGGLPRVVELFEARSPRNKAVLARTNGVIRMAEDDSKGRVIVIVSDDGEEDVYSIPRESRLEVKDGQEVVAGDALVEGPRDPKELLEIKGVRATQQYLVDQVQKVYRDQGVSIHDKHIELIVRQMTRRVAIQEPGDTDFLPGERVDARVFAEVNRQAVSEGRTPAEGRPELMGITKASLATDSWLSAASFQETTRVLTEAAIGSRSDSLLGLKENIIIGKLIPAGTGMANYRDVAITAPDFEPMEYWSSESGESPEQWLANLEPTEPDAEIIDLMTGGGSAVQ
jgi:DNA-directed RNA polymerase subunit beta'